MTRVDTFTAAALSFAAQVRNLDESDWEKPGLGEWDVRALVGHMSRSLITVGTYLRQPADREDITGAADYYVMVRDFAANAGAEAVAERGRQAGRDLGGQPAATIDALVERVLGDLDGVDDPLIEVIGGLGIRLSSYLPTRVFELAVHGLDLGRAVGAAVTLPADVLEEATVLAARIGVALGDGDRVLSALTGRIGLPPDFSVV